MIAIRGPTDARRGADQHRVRDIPTQVRLDRDDGMPVECAATTDTITVVDGALLTERITRLSAPRMAEICRALATSVDCAFPR